uniref:Helicase ATP-binding domain-containing protein n=1 Tax=Alexandrium monilatum TaxID=311494 RepID=A0A7S4PT28_9DINO
MRDAAAGRHMPTLQLRGYGSGLAPATASGRALRSPLGRRAGPRPTAAAAKSGETVLAVLTGSALWGALAAGVARRRWAWTQRRCRRGNSARCRIWCEAGRADMQVVSEELQDDVAAGAEAFRPGQGDRPSEAAGSMPGQRDRSLQPGPRGALPRPWLVQHLPKERGLHVDSQDLLLRFLAALDGRGVQLYPAQEEAAVELFRGMHVILDTPTGSGKSLVAVAACFHALGRGQRAYYTSPTKALVSEKFFDLCRYFGTENVGLATGDASVNTRAPLVCCTAEVLTSIALHEGRTAAVDCVIMDEFHYYGDAARGAAWEIPLWRLPHVAFLLMSGTLGANPQLYRAIEVHSGRPLSVVSSTERPVPLDFTYSDNSVRSTLAALVREDKYPVYVVHFSQREAFETARTFAEDPMFSPSVEQRAALEEFVAGTDFGSPFGAELRELLLHGVGLHHAGLLPRYRRVVEQLAQASLLMVICGTDTLGVGVNVPIRSVLLTRLCKFNGQDTSLLQPREFLQIAGRAGRKGFDNRGEVVAVTPEWQVFNRELAERLKQGHEGGRPRWKRPPRRNYKHWTEKTFRALQTKPPAPLKSRFQLSMGQVLSVLHGASANGRDALQELRQLVDSAQCSWRQRRFLHRQVAAFVQVLVASGTISKEVIDGAAGVPAAHATASPADGGSDAAPSPGVSPGEAPTAGGGGSPDSLTFMDDSSLFLLEVLPVLEEQVGAGDYHLAVVAAAEAVCEAPTALLRARTEPSSVGLCPEPLERLLLRSFAAFQYRHPWVAEGALKPKGFALHLVEGRLSFGELVASLTANRFDRAVVIAEGGLLRYLAEVYRTLRRSVPPALKTAAVVEAEGRLRAAVASVDSSLLREWEHLHARERGQGSGQAPEGEAEEAVGGAMVPRAEAGQQRRPRTRSEIERRVLEVGAELAERRRQREEVERAQARHPLTRARRMGSKLWAVVAGGLQTALEAVW